jgi:signal transduction histidine kinase
VGRLVKRRFSLTPTSVATFFTLAALGLPCAAWYVTGSRVVDQEAERLRRGPRVRAQQEARRIADRLSTRLEALRLSETRRSFLDYNPQPHSPLAEGPADPMIWAHFQMDGRGRLTLPTLTPGPDAERGEEALQAQQAILETLECALTKPLSAFPANVEGGSTQRYPGPDGEKEATVGTLRWATIELEGEPALIAARTVRLPTATLSQGFAVRPTGLRAYVGDAPSPASIRPGAPDGPTQARIPIVGVPWTVVVDGSADAAEADRLAAEIVSRFRKTFAGGLFAALFAGGLVVSLVWQSERLASQRARFAASAAHELRTPLAGLRMYGEMLADGSEEPERDRRYARRIAGEAERLGRVVSNLLGFSRLERGELVFDSTPGELCSTVRTSIEQLRPALEASGARIDTHIEDSLPQVRFNRDAVHQILQNLLDNAEKYGRSAEDRTIRVEVARNGDGVRLSVVDHGPGLDPTLRRSLFRPFVRNTAPDAPAGLGLGLAIVQALARAQKATVGYSPEPGGGSRFTVGFAC